MPKPRTKRGQGREGRKRKHDAAGDHDTKRRRVDLYHDHDHDNDNDGGADYQYDQEVEEVPTLGHQDGPGEREFFGMLADEEQEYFRRADEMLELDQFPSRDERSLFLQSVYREARGKELKLASSQSCSRLMERLIQLASTAQKKRLFAAFAGHFLSLVRHRFASHCCEALFLRSAGVVSQELAGFVLDTQGAAAAAKQEDGNGNDDGGDGDGDGAEESIEMLFLAALDELEGNMGYLMTDKFGSHVLRVLLLVLSGRPLEDAAFKTLLRSRKKETVSVAGSAAVDEQNRGLRAVPPSFHAAVIKIVRDSTSAMDAAGLRVLATHPVGNPTLQLLLELDMALNKSAKKTDATNAEQQQQQQQQSTLLFQLLPGAPQSLADESSGASEFVHGMMYDPIGSRLMEIIIAHCPGKVFRALNQNILLPRIQGYVRNDVSCYPVIRVLQRIGKDQLVEAVAKIGPTAAQLVCKKRFNVLRTLFERCAARGLQAEIRQLMKGVREGCGPEPGDLVRTLCPLAVAEAEEEEEEEEEASEENEEEFEKQEEEEEEEGKKKKKNKRATAGQMAAKAEYAMQSHGAQLLTCLLAIPGPAKGVQEAVLAVSSGVVMRLATGSAAGATLVVKALQTGSEHGAFQKAMVRALGPRVSQLAVSRHGYVVVAGVAGLATKGREGSVPVHLKEGVMETLGEQEGRLRECWMGRKVWRAWRGDVWKTRRGEWKAWVRGMGEKCA